MGLGNRKPSSSPSLATASGVSLDYCLLSVIGKVGIFVTLLGSWKARDKYVLTTDKGFGSEGVGQEKCRKSIVLTRSSQFLSPVARFVWPLSRLCDVLGSTAPA